MCVYVPKWDCKDSCSLSRESAGPFLSPGYDEHFTLAVCSHITGVNNSCLILFPHGGKRATAGHLLITKSLTVTQIKMHGLDSQCDTNLEKLTWVTSFPDRKSVKGISMQCVFIKTAMRQFRHDRLIKRPLKNTGDGGQ